MARVVRDSALTAVGAGGLMRVEIIGLWRWESPHRRRRVTKRRLARVKRFFVKNVKRARGDYFVYATVAAFGARYLPRNARKNGGAP